MSMHKIPLTQIEEAGLRAHGLDIGTPSQLSDAFRHGVRFASAQLPSQGGEAVAVVAYITRPSRMTMDGWEDGEEYAVIASEASDADKRYDVPLMTVAQHQRIMAATTHPADQVEDDLTMVKVSRELLERVCDHLEYTALGSRSDEVSFELRDELSSLMRVKDE